MVRFMSALKIMLTGMVIGGGYVMYAIEAHFHLLLETIRSVQGNGGKLAVLFLSYGIFPEESTNISSIMVLR